VGVRLQVGGNAVSSAYSTKREGHTGGREKHLRLNQGEFRGMRREPTIRGAAWVKTGPSRK